MGASEQTKKDFDDIDTDDDGYITAAELKESLKSNPKVSDENAAAIVQMADDDGDRKINYEEYAKLVK
jgi:Ca2+-binding EF-hand superfamily protein